LKKPLNSGADKIPAQFLQLGEPRLELLPQRALIVRTGEGDVI
jgi:hypothetical protein